VTAVAVVASGTDRKCVALEQLAILTPYESLICGALKLDHLLAFRAVKRLVSDAQALVRAVEVGVGCDAHKPAFSAQPAAERFRENWTYHAIPAF
jgi:hypothetical protein